MASYNIHGCIGTDGRFDPSRTAKVLQELRADVIALQEVEADLDRPENVLSYLAQEAGLHAIAGPTLLRNPGHYGNALLVRGAPADINRIDLSVPGAEPRGALELTISHQGTTVHVVATHLGLRPKERRWQVQQLLGLFEAKGADGHVLMGDLNEWFLWGRPLRSLHALFEATPHPPTFPSRLPVLALDRIWVRPRRSLARVAVHASPLARIASDHLPITGVVEAGRMRA